MTASTLTYPLDLIRTKLSINMADSTVKPSILGIGRKIVQEGGYISLYKGLPSTLFVSHTMHLNPSGFFFFVTGNHSLHRSKDGFF